MSDNVSSIFQRYTKPVSRLQGTDGNGKEIYQPFDLEPNGLAAHRVRVHSSTGQFMLLNYSNLIDLYASNGAVSLLFTSIGVYMEGDNLYDMIDEIQRDRIYALRPYDPNRHTLDSKNPIVIKLLQFENLNDLGKPLSR